MFINTGQTGAQTQIDVNHLSTWMLTPLTDVDLGGGLFTMKTGQSTTATVTLSLYSGTSATGPLLTSVTLTQVQFCTGYANCSQFAVHTLAFTTPYVLQTGQRYFAALTSTANDVQSQAYFIKDDTPFISLANGDPVDPPPVSFEAVPEPGTFLLSGAGLAALFLGLARRARKTT